MQTRYSGRKGPPLTWRAWLTSAHLHGSPLGLKAQGLGTQRRITSTGGFDPGQKRLAPPTRTRTRIPYGFVPGSWGASPGGRWGTVRTEACGGARLGLGSQREGRGACPGPRAPGGCGGAGRAWAGPGGSLLRGRRVRGSRRARGQGARWGASKVRDADAGARCPACRGSPPPRASGRPLCCARVQMRARGEPEGARPPPRSCGARVRVVLPRFRCPPRWARASRQAGRPTQLQRANECALRPHVEQHARVRTTWLSARCRPTARPCTAELRISGDS